MPISSEVTSYPSPSWLDEQQLSLAMDSPKVIHLQRSSSSARIGSQSSPPPTTPIPCSSSIAQLATPPSSHTASPLQPMVQHPFSDSPLRTASSLPSPPIPSTQSPIPPPFTLSQATTASSDSTTSASPVAIVPPQRTHPMVTRSQNMIFKPKHVFLVTKSPPIEPVEPTCVSQALKDPNWRKAMSDEFTALVRQGTWDLVPPSLAQNVIGCKWVFRLKRRVDGSIERYKARLVPKDYHQQPGFDYSETFSLVIKLVTLRTVLSVAIKILHRANMSEANVVASPMASSCSLQQGPGNTLTDPTVYRLSNVFFVTLKGAYIMDYFLLPRLDSPCMATKQRAVAQSFTEVEYRALAAASSKMVWVKHLLTELGVSCIGSPTVYYDNLGATYLSSTLFYYSRSLTCLQLINQIHYHPFPLISILTSLLVPIFPRMAYALVSAILGQLATVISKEVGQEVKLVTSIEKEINKLKSNLNSIQALLLDIEERQIENRSI
ncbi:hypothetical protein SLEP1_g19009 [Rubroshorea leprosula]|nr:hypothetical protein SLEP1_g19009 [Rubroshorea leprosula]